MACCAIKHCKNYSTKKDTPKKTFHLFPRDTNLSNRWADIVRESRNESCWKPNTWSCICSDHFSIDDKYITKSGHQRIKTGAVPCQALVLSPKSDDIEESESVEDHESDVKTPTAKKKRSRPAGKRPKPDGNSGRIQLPEAKEIITSVYKYLQTEFDNLNSNISSDCDLTPLGNILKRTAEATGVSEQTVTALLENSKRPLESTHKTVKRKRTKSSHCFENVRPIKEESISEEEIKSHQTDDGQRAQSNKQLLTVKVKIEDEDEHRNAVQEKLRVDIEVISCEAESAVVNLLSTHSDETDEPMDSDYQQTNSAVQHLLSSELSEMKEESDDTENWQSTSAVHHTPPDAVHHPVKTELYDDD